MADRIPAACDPRTIEVRMATAEDFNAAVHVMAETLAECAASLLRPTDFTENRTPGVTRDAIAEDSDGYVCAFTNDAPWMTTSDIHQDGVIGQDDVKALLWQDESSRPDRDPEWREIDCEKVNVGFLEAEVTWKLQGLFAGLPDRPEAAAVADARAADAVAQVDEIETDALRRLRGHEARMTRIAEQWRNRKGVKRHDLSWATVEETRGEIVEMALRAKSIIKGADDEPFGVGVKLVPTMQWFSDGFPLEIRGIHAASAAAAAGIQRGDLLEAIDGRPMRAWSRDGTIDGLYDPHTELIHGMAGPRHSKVRLTMRRDNSTTFDVTVERNIWSARTLGSTPVTPFYTGTEQASPGSKRSK